MATKRIECHKTELSDVQHYSLSKGLIYFICDKINLNTIFEGYLRGLLIELTEDYLRIIDLTIDNEELTLVKFPYVNFPGN